MYDLGSLRKGIASFQQPAEIATKHRIVREGTFTIERYSRLVISTVDIDDSDDIG